MPVTSDTRNRVVAVPARIQGYNTLDKKIKGLGLRVTPHGRKIWFLQVMHHGKRHYHILFIGGQGKRGAEAGCMRQRLGDRVTLIASASLAVSYERALVIAGIDSTLLDVNAVTVAGLGTAARTLFDANQAKGTLL